MARPPQDRVDVSPAEPLEPALATGGRDAAGVERGSLCSVHMVVWPRADCGDCADCILESTVAYFRGRDVAGDGEPRNVHVGFAGDSAPLAVELALAAMPLGATWDIVVPRGMWGSWRPLAAPAAACRGESGGGDSGQSEARGLSGDGSGRDAGGGASASDTLVCRVQLLHVGAARPPIRPRAEVEAEQAQAAQAAAERFLQDPPEPWDVRLANAAQHKDAGNECLRAGDATGAQEEFNLGFALLFYSQEEAQVRPASAQEAARVTAMRTVLHANRAAAKLRLGDDQGAWFDAARALQGDPSHVRARFRLAAAGIGILERRARISGAGGAAVAVGEGAAADSVAPPPPTEAAADAEAIVRGTLRVISHLLRVVLALDPRLERGCGAHTAADAESAQAAVWRLSRAPPGANLARVARGEATEPPAVDPGAGTVPWDSAPPPDEDEAEVDLCREDTEAEQRWAAAQPALQVLGELTRAWRGERPVRDLLYRAARVSRAAGGGLRAIRRRRRELAQQIFRSGATAAPRDTGDVGGADGDSGGEDDDLPPLE